MSSVSGHFRPFQQDLSFPFGLSLGYLMNASFLNGNLVSDPDDFKKTDLNLQLGVEYELLPKLWVQGRFAYSLYNITKQTNKNFRFRNNVIQLTFMYDL